MHHPEGTLTNYLHSFFNIRRIETRTLELFTACSKSGSSLRAFEPEPRLVPPLNETSPPLKNLVATIRKKSW